MKIIYDFHWDLLDFLIFEKMSDFSFVFFFRCRKIILFLELRKNSHMISDPKLYALSNGAIFRAIAALLRGERRR